MPQQGFVFPEWLAASVQRPARCLLPPSGDGWHRTYRQPVADPKVGQGRVAPYRRISVRGVTVAFLCDPQTGEIVAREVLSGRDGEELAKSLAETVR